MYRQLHRIYRLGKPGGEAATSIPFYRRRKPGSANFEPLDKGVGMGMEPSMLHYFGKEGELDPDYVKHVINSRLASKGRRGREAAAKEREEEERMARLFGQA